VGRIASISGDEIVIDFVKKRGHSMALKMAVDALQILSKDHIWVLKAAWKKEKLYAKIKSDPSWALKTIILSFNNSYDIKKLKNELVPSVLPAEEWAVWSGKVRKILKSDPSFEVTPESVDVFSVRERPNSLSDKILNEFRAERKFFKRVDLLYSFLELKDMEAEAESLIEIIGYFLGYLKSPTQINETVMGSYLLVKQVSVRVPGLVAAPTLNFVNLFNGIEDVNTLFFDLKDKRLQEDFLTQVKMLVSSWQDVYVALFPLSLLERIIDALQDDGKVGAEKLTLLVRRCYENYRKNKEAVVWFYRNARERDWYKDAGVAEEKELLTLIYILDLCYREIESHRDTAENRKTAKLVFAILITEGMVSRWIDSAGKDTSIRLFSLIEDVKALDPAEKLKLRNQIRVKFPDFKFRSAVGKETVSRVLFVTSAKYEEKSRELSRIMEEEVPKNSKEIAFALSLGDLRENAEYKAAKERQELLNATVAKLKDEMDRAQRFDPSTFSPAKAGFGAKVVLLNEALDKDEEYTIFGPWESDPDKKIISYLSPFGAAILNKKPGEKFVFSVGEENVQYTVKEISAAMPV
jgi:transcription elongation factor GreA